MTGRDLAFGIYPLGVAGTPTGLATGPPDDDEQIGAALRELGGSSGTLPARTYAVYAGPRSSCAVSSTSSAGSGVAGFARETRPGVSRAP